MTLVRRSLITEVDNTDDHLRDGLAMKSNNSRTLGQVEIMDNARTGLRALLTLQSKNFFLLLLAWVAFGLYIRLPRIDDQEVLSNIGKDSSSTVTNPRLPAADLHLLVPASKRDPNVCKLMVSAAIAGFPAPVLINWDQDYEDESFVEGEAHLAKIRGVHEYLDGLHPSQYDDMILVLDGLDVWLQSRAQTLIERYFAINRRADALIAASVGANAAAKYGVRQEIIFGSQKTCAPWTTDDPPCSAIPHSSIPDDSSTAENIPASPRYLDSGVTIGTARAMRKLYKQALEYLPSHTNVGSDRYIFAQLLNDQEIWREIVRRDSPSWSFSASNEDFNTERVKDIRAKAASQEDGNLDFGIGLDFDDEISLNVGKDKHAAAWVNHDDKSAQGENSGNRTTDYLRSDLATDILTSPPPFWTFNFEPRLQTSRWISWSNVSLLTDDSTGVVPAVIQHSENNADDWGRMWFSSHVRTMYDLSVLEPITPLASVTGYDDTTRREYWPARREKGGALNGFEWVGFDGACNEWHEEIFGDGLGPYIVPEHP